MAQVQYDARFSSSVLEYKEYQFALQVEGIVNPLSVAWGWIDATRAMRAAAPSVSVVIQPDDTLQLMVANMTNTSPLTLDNLKLMVVPFRAG